MKNNALLHSIREQTAIITNCRSLHEIQSLILKMENIFENYSIADQGFLLSMIGMTIMKISDSSQYNNLHDSRIKLLLQTRVNWGNQDNGENSGLSQDSHG